MMSRTSNGKVSIRVSGSAAAASGGAFSYVRRFQARSESAGTNIAGGRTALPAWVAWIEDDDGSEAGTWYWSGRPVHRGP